MPAEATRERVAFAGKIPSHGGREGGHDRKNCLLHSSWASFSRICPCTRRTGNGQSGVRRRGVLLCRLRGPRMIGHARQHRNSRSGGHQGQTCRQWRLHWIGPAFSFITRNCPSISAPKVEGWALVSASRTAEPLKEFTGNFLQGRERFGKGRHLKSGATPAAP